MSPMIVQCQHLAVDGLHFTAVALDTAEALDHTWPARNELVATDVKIALRHDLRDSGLLVPCPQVLVDSAVHRAR